MKTPIYMIFAYLFLIVFGTAALAVVFMVFQACTMLVSGESLFFFSAPLFWAGILESFPVCVIATSLFVPLYVVRHPETALVPTFAVYLALSFLSWGVLLPLSASFMTKNQQAIEEMEEKKFGLPSVGYFREVSGSIDYFTAVRPSLDSEDGRKRASADGISIAKTDAQANGKTETFSKREIFANNSSLTNFSDVIIERTLKMPTVVWMIVFASQHLKAQAFQAISGGIISWVCFASLGAALFSVFLLRGLSTYKLSNCIIVIFSYLSIIAFNVSYFELPIFASFRDSGSNLGSISSFVAEPPLVAVNIAVFLVFTIWGILSSMFNGNRRSEF